MTISVSTNSVTWLGNGATTVFTYTFAIPATADVTVLYTTAAGVQTTVAPGAYTITGVGQPTAGGGPQGGTLTYAPGGAPIPAGSQLTLIRSVPGTQPNSFSNQGGLWPSVVEATADLLAMQIQQLASGLGRALLFNPADTGPFASFPPAAQRALQLLGFDSAGNPVAAAPTSALVSTAMQPFVLAASTQASTTLLDVLASLAGATVRRLIDKIYDVLSVADFGAVGDGVTDDTAAINAALAAAAPGQEVWLSPTGQHVVASGNINIPAGVILRGRWNGPGNTLASKVSGQPTSLAALNSALILAGAYTVNVGSAGGIKGVPIYRQGLVTPATSAAMFAGVAITIAGDDCYVGYCLVMGFAQLLTSNTYTRGKFEWIYGDNQAGVSIVNAYDTPYIHHCHFWPYVTYSAAATLTYHHRTGTAFQVDGTALPSLSHCFCFCYFAGYQLSGSGGAVLVDCQADNDAAYAGTIGFSLGTSTQGVTASKAIGCTAFNCATGYYIATSATDYMEFVSCSADGCGAAVNLTQGDIRWIGGVWDNCTSGITVVSATSAVVLTALKTQGIGPGAVVTNTGGGGLIYVSPDCDFDTLPPGYSISSTMAPNIVASASPLLLPAFGDVFQLSGTTSFGAIDGGWAGRKLTLIFTASLTVTNSNLAGGVRLTGATNFTTAASSTLSLVYNGYQWFETGRCA
jgi:hypothetical protein